MAYFNGKEVLLAGLKGDSAFVRYSAHADGSDFTETHSEGQNYIGFASGQKAPTDKTEYTWIYLGGYDGSGEGSVNIVQTTGDSETEVMSQKAVTDELQKMNNRLGNVETDLIDI